VDHVSLYRWVQYLTPLDQHGQMIDVYVSPRRDLAAAGSLLF